MMTDITFTFSPILRHTLQRIDRYRQTILSIPILPRKEIEIRHEATNLRILAALRLADIPMTMQELTGLLARNPKRPHPIEREALLYRQALMYIRDEWTGQTQPLTVSAIEILMHVAVPMLSRHISRAIWESSSDIRHLISYIETQPDHPVIAAGLTHAYMARTRLHTYSGGRMTLLISGLILTRHGYDCRGMLSLESELTRDRNAYTHALDSVGQLGQMTVWLEYYTACVAGAYETLLENFERTDTGNRHRNTSASILNTRQNQIRMLLDMPGAKITNREVQKRFHVSQITASRDLTRLVSYGFLTSSGKGRSVYYTLA